VSLLRRELSVELEDILIERDYLTATLYPPPPW
jgi:hypothetical protein